MADDDRVPMTDPRHGGADGVEPGSPSDNTTILAVLQGYADAGWDGDFALRADGLQCLTCHQVSPLDTVAVAGVRRVEGASDPADMAAVVATSCPRCGARGTVVVSYGTDASPEGAALLSRAGGRLGDGPQAGAGDER